MNKNIMKKIGFERELNQIKENKCPFCAKIVNDSGFRNELSRREYHISGLCQECQDSVFGK